MKLREFIDSTRKLLDAGVFAESRNELGPALRELCSALEEKRDLDPELIAPCVYITYSKNALYDGNLTPIKAWKFLHHALDGSIVWNRKHAPLFLERLNGEFEKAEYSDKFKELFLTTLSDQRQKNSALNDYIEDLPRNESEATTEHLEQPGSPLPTGQAEPNYNFLLYAAAALSLAAAIASLIVVILALASVIALPTAGIIAAAAVAAVATIAPAYAAFKFFRPAPGSNVGQATELEDQVVTTP